MKKFKKKVTAWLLIFALVFSLSPVSVFAADTDLTENIESTQLSQQDNETQQDTNQQETADVVQEEVSNPEQEEATNSEQEEATTPEQEEATTPEQEEATNSEQEEVTNPEQEEVSNPEQEEVTNPEQEEVTNPEQEEVTDPEQEEVADPEQEEATEPEQEEVTEPEQEEVTDPEQGEVIDPEQEEVTNPKQEEVTEPEQEEVTEPEQEEVTEPEQEEATEPEQEEASSPEQEKVTEPEQEKTADKLAVDEIVKGEAKLVAKTSEFKLEFVVDEAVAAVQELINALPAAETVSLENFEEIQIQVATVYEAIDELTPEQAEQLDLASLLALLETVALLAETDMVAEVNNTPYASFAEAVNAADAGATVTLLQDIDLGATTFNIAAGQDIVLDLNGKTISSNISEPTTPAIQVEGKLTIKDGVGNGAIETNSTAISVIKEGTVIVENGTIQSAKGQAIASNNQNATNGTLTINGGNIIADYFTAIYWPSGGNVTITGGSITGGTGIEARAGNIEISGGTITGIMPDKENIDHVPISGGSWSEGSAVQFVSQFYEPVLKVNITGGKFIGETNKGIRIYHMGVSGKPAAEINISNLDEISGLNGEIYIEKAADVNDFGGIDISLTESTADITRVQDGFYLSNVNGQYAVTALGDNVAIINNIVYTTLQAAVDAANAGDTVTLLKNVTESITINGTVTLYIPENVTLTNSENNHTINVTENGNLTITGTGTVDNVSPGYAALNNEGTITEIAGCTFTRSRENKQTDGSGDNSYYTVRNIGEIKLISGGNFNNNGTFSSTFINGDYQKGKYTGSIGEITGGTFQGGKIALKNDPNCTIGNISGANILGSPIYNSSEKNEKYSFIALLNYGTIGTVENTVISSSGQAIYTSGGYSEASITLGDGVVATAKNSTLVIISTKDGKENETNTIITGGEYYAVKPEGTYPTMSGDSSTLIISGGKFSRGARDVVEDCLVPGMKWDDANCTVIPVEIAKVINSDGTETNYTSLQAAVDAANAGATVTLLQDIDLGDTTFSIAADKDIVLDLNGKTISSNISEPTTPAIQVEGKLTIKDGAENGALETNSTAIYVAGEGTVIVENGTIQSAKGQAIASNNLDTTNGTLTINGGNIIADYFTAIYWPSAGNLTVTGGNITGGTGIEAKAGNIEISGGTITGTMPDKGKDKENIDHAPVDGGSWSEGSAVQFVSQFYEPALTVNITGGTFIGQTNKGIRIYHMGVPGKPVAEINISNLDKVSGPNGKIYIEKASDDFGETDIYLTESTVSFTKVPDGYKCKRIDAGKYIVAKECADHTEVVVAAVEPTCTEPGFTEGKYCPVCGEIIVVQQEISATGHTAVVDEAVAPTCTETGLTAGSHCSVCKAVIVAQETVPANGHKAVVDAAVEPTCTETGLTEGKHCSVCNTVIVAQETVSANGHTAVVDAAVEPTCTETGLTEGSHCSVCNTVIVAQEEIPATGHKAVVDAAVAATCTETGLTAGSHCSVCNTVIVAQETVSATGHTEVVDAAVAPTTTTTGLTEGSHCSVCGAVLVAQETIPVLPPEVIAVTGVTLNQNALTLTVGDTATLTVAVAPSDASNSAVSWSSSNTAVATVAGGVVTAVAPGTVNITVTTVDGSFTAVCAVTVNAASTSSGDSDGDGGDGGGSSSSSSANTIINDPQVPLSETTIGENQTPLAENPIVFEDVKENDWFYDAVYGVANKELMTGVSETLFAPNDNTTRGMIVTVLYRLENKPLVEATSNFSDVLADQWYADAVVWATSLNVVKGYGDSTFGPNDNITREQLAAILYRYAESKGMDVSVVDDLSSFSDASAVSDYAKTAMQWAVAAKLINGNADGTLAPTAQATRAEVAAILMRFMENA